jgi:ribosomal-protein-alanine N-acetyltransferase
MLIRTSRFVLRDLDETDRGAFIGYLLDSRNRRLYGRSLAHEDEAAVFFHHFLSWKRAHPRLNIQLGIFEHESGRFCGFAGLRKDRQRQDKAAFELELAADCWGRYRMAVEVTEAVLSYGFEHLDINIVVGVTASGDERAAKLARWFGAKAVTLRKGPAWMRERGWHEVDWALTRHDWIITQASPHRPRRKPLVEQDQ